MTSNSLIHLRRHDGHARCSPEDVAWNEGIPLDQSTDDEGAFDCPACKVELERLDAEIAAGWKHIGKALDEGKIGQVVLIGEGDVS